MVHNGRLFVCINRTNVPTVNAPVLVFGHHAVAIFGHFVLDSLIPYLFFLPLLKRHESRLACSAMVAGSRPS